MINIDLSNKKTRILLGAGMIILIIIVLIWFGSYVSENVKKDINSHLSSSPALTPSPTSTKTEEPKKVEIPIELDAKVTYNNMAFKIDNNEDRNWTNCKFKVNDAYEYRADEGINAKDSLIIPYTEFTKKDGTRLNIYLTKAKNMYISCDSEGKNNRYNYFMVK